MASKPPAVKRSRTVGKAQTQAAAPTKTHSSPAKRIPTSRAATPRSRPHKAPLPSVPPASKQSLLIAALRSGKGASVTQLAEVTGWQHHTIRGAISGVLRKKLGLTVVTEKAEGGAIYRIVGPLTAA